MTESPLRILAIGAHPDDCDVKAGGVAARYSRAGHVVRFVSVTNGDAGHHQIGGVALARRRAVEATAAADVIGIEYQILDHHDGELVPSLENRHEMIRLIREFQPDLILTHRPNDYHPDHRYTSQLVQDAAYMVTVPNVCPGTPHLERNPHMAYLYDTFEKPYAFACDIAVDITQVIEQKIAMLTCHASQAFEWLPYNMGVLDQVPTAPEGRVQWIRDWCHQHCGVIADEARESLLNRYGEPGGRTVQHAEAFEICEYGAPFTEETIRRLFPFFE